MVFCFVQNNTSSFSKIMSVLFSLNKHCETSSSSGVDSCCGSDSGCGSDNGCGSDSGCGSDNGCGSDGKCSAVICCTEELRDEIMSFHALPSRISLDFYILENMAFGKMIYQWIDSVNYCLDKYGEVMVFDEEAIMFGIPDVSHLRKGDGHGDGHGGSGIGFIKKMHLVPHAHYSHLFSREFFFCCDKVKFDKYSSMLIKAHKDMTDHIFYPNAGDGSDDGSGGDADSDGKVDDGFGINVVEKKPLTIQNYVRGINDVIFNFIHEDISQHYERVKGVEEVGDEVSAGDSQDISEEDKQAKAAALKKAKMEREGELFDTFYNKMEASYIINGSFLCSEDFFGFFSNEADKIQIVKDIDFNDFTVKKFYNQYYRKYGSDKDIVKFSLRGVGVGAGAGAGVGTGAGSGADDDGILVIDNSVSVSADGVKVDDGADAAGDSAGVKAVGCGSKICGVILRTHEKNPQIVEINNYILAAIVNKFDDYISLMSLRNSNKINFFIPNLKDNSGDDAGGVSAEGASGSEASGGDTKPKVLKIAHWNRNGLRWFEGMKSLFKHFADVSKYVNLHDSTVNFKINDVLVLSAPSTIYLTPDMVASKHFWVSNYDADGSVYRELDMCGLKNQFGFYYAEHPIVFDVFVTACRRDGDGDGDGDCDVGKRVLYLNKFVNDVVTDKLRSSEDYSYYLNKIRYCAYVFVDKKTFSCMAVAEAMGLGRPLVVADDICDAVSFGGLVKGVHFMTESEYKNMNMVGGDGAGAGAGAGAVSWKQMSDACCEYYDEFVKPSSVLNNICKRCFRA